MCLSIPGRVVKLEGELAEVDYGKTVRKAKTRLLKPKVNDYVLVSGGHVVEVLDEKDAGKIIDEWKKINSI